MPWFRTILQSYSNQNSMAGSTGNLQASPHGSILRAVMCWSHARAAGAEHAVPPGVGQGELIPLNTRKTNNPMSLCGVMGPLPGPQHPDAEPPCPLTLSLCDPQFLPCPLPPLYFPALVATTTSAMELPSCLWLEASSSHPRNADPTREEDCLQEHPQNCRWQATCHSHLRWLIHEGKDKVGILQHPDGTVLKQLQPPPKGPRELEFYNMVYAADCTDGVLL